MATSAGRLRPVVEGSDTSGEFQYSGCGPAEFMRLGFDLDGTLADMQGALAREARRLFPEVNPESLPKSAAPDAASEPRGAGGAATPAASGEGPQSTSIGGLTQKQQSELWKAVCAQANWWESLAEIEPGALARLFAMVQERKWELIFLTSRPETRGDTAQLQSYRWLMSKGYASPSVFVVHGSRGKIAAALNLDVLVDDRPENCLDVAIDSQARPILVWRGDEAKVPASARQLGIGSVASIAECLDILAKLDEPDTIGATLVDRLKRLFGFKPSAQRRAVLKGQTGV